MVVNHGGLAAGAMKLASGISRAISSSSRTSSSGASSGTRSSSSSSSNSSNKNTSSSNKTSNLAEVYAHDAFGNPTFTLEVEENPLSLNLYTYCHNEPVNYVDPSGHFPLGIIGGTVAGIGTIVDTKNGPVIDYSSGGGDSYSSSSNSSSGSSSSNSSSSSYQSPAIKLIGTAIDTLYGTVIDYIYGNGKNSSSYATKINSLEKETNDKELLTASPRNFFEKIMPLVRINIGDESTILGTYIDGTLVTEVNSLAKGLGGEVNGSVFKQTVTIDGKTIVYNINYVLNGKGKRW
jgi:hypothetical protein